MAVCAAMRPKSPSMTSETAISSRAELRPVDDGLGLDGLGRLALGRNLRDGALLDLDLLGVGVVDTPGCARNASSSSRIACTWMSPLSRSRTTRAWAAARGVFL